MKKDAKRYLVTYANGSISTADAQQILNVTGRQCHEGVAFLEGEVKPTENDVLHFENLGVSSLALTDSEIKKLESDERVLAVEEDVEMHVLEINDDLAMETSHTDFNLQEDDFDDLNDDMDQTQSSAIYSTGYKQAMVDMFASMIELNPKGLQNGEINGLSSDALNSTRPILRPFPFPRPIQPPIFRQPIPWNINLVKAPKAWQRGITGRGINVAVLDTGIASHSDLVIRGGVSFIPGVVSYNDGHSHGTHCAGIIGARNNFFGVVGVAPACNLYAVKVLADNGSGSSSWIISGMEWCIQNNIQVASMSLGGLGAPSVAYANAIKRCQDAGVTVVVASGNSFGSAFPWVNAPANSIMAGSSNASPIAVGAVDRNCIIGTFSSRGGQTNNWNQVKVVAPGVNINSTVLGGAYATKTGTSMATPHVAGQVALIKQRFPSASVAFIKSKIFSTSTDLGQAGYDNTYGYGLINCDLSTI